MEPRTRAAAQRPVEAVEEVRFSILVHGQPPSALTASPCDAADLAAGHLFARGYPADDLRSATYAVDGRTVRVELSDGAAEAGACLRTHLHAHGVGHVLDCAGCAALLRRGRVAPPDDETLRDLMAGIFGGAAGVHAAALARAGRIALRVEDVGRHSAVDRLVGAALRRGWDGSELGLATTARVSGEMAFKAARAGCAWIASRSVPTTLAVDIAGLVGLPIVARAGSTRARTFGP